MLFLAALLLSSSAPAMPDPPAPGDGAPFTADELDRVRQARSLAVSPDGRWVAWEEWRADGDRGNADLWLAPTDGSAPPRRLTFDLGKERRPAWATDSRHLYFEQSRPMGAGRSAQVHRLDLDTGRIEPLTEVEGGVDLWAPSPVGDQLYLVTHDAEERKDPFSALRSKHEAPTYVDSAPRRSALHTVDLKTWRVEPVHTGEHAIYDLAVSPDGRFLALLTSPDGPLIHREGGSELKLVDRLRDTVSTVPSDLYRQDAPSPYGWLHDLAWSPDSRQLAFGLSYDGHPGTLQVVRIDPSADEGFQSLETLARDGDWSFLGGGLQWHPRGDRICATVSDHASIQVRCQRPEEPVPSELLTPGDRVIMDWRFLPRGRSLVAVEAGARSPGEVVVVDAGKPGSARTLSSLNPQLAELELPSIERFTWTAPDGVEVEGILELPPGYEAERDGPLPTVIHLHGGPTWASHRYLRLRGDGRTTFASRGWALLSPNYRGSTGYGDDFMVELVGRENEVEVADILAGVDALVEAGIADADELAVMGWSNGGYLTNCLITRTDRFKAASSGAGVFDQTIQWALEDTPGHVINYMEGLPWEQPEEMQAASPLFAAGEITTPTIIHVGEHDPRVPAAHARALHRALSFYLDVPTELIIYPGEGHGLSRQAHRAARVAWDEAWFDLYVRGLEPGGPGSEGEPPPPVDR